MHILRVLTTPHRVYARITERAAGAEKPTPTARILMSKADAFEAFRDVGMNPGHA